MKALKFKKGVAEAMARDIMAARRKILRRADPGDTWILMRLADNLKDLGQADHLEALANRFETGNHYVGRNLEIDDPEEAQGVANEMAADLRVFKSHMEELVDEPITEDRLRHAEEICRNYGVTLSLLSRTGGAGESFLN